MSWLAERNSVERRILHAYSAQPTENNRNAQRKRAELYPAMGNLEQALADYNRMLQIWPENIMAYLNRASVYIDQADYAQSEADYRRALEITEDRGLRRLIEQQLQAMGLPVP